MRRALVGVVLCVGSVVGVGAGSAFAGEITGGPEGPHKITPIKADANNPAAGCAFSGLEDDLNGTPGETQTPANHGEPGEASVCSYWNNGSKP